MLLFPYHFDTIVEVAQKQIKLTEEEIKNLKIHQQYAISLFEKLYVDHKKFIEKQGAEKKIALIDKEKLSKKLSSIIGDSKTEVINQLIGRCLCVIETAEKECKEARDKATNIWEKAASRMCVWPKAVSPIGTEADTINKVVITFLEHLVETGMIASYIEAKKEVIINL